MKSVHGCAWALVLVAAGVAHAQETGPWKVVVTPNANPLRVAECSPVRIEVTDAKGVARNSKGALITLADFDVSVTADRDGAIVGRYDGASAWSACACPGAAGVTATITATYPRRSLAPDARAPGVAVRSSISVPVIAGRSSAVPIGCEVEKTSTVGAGRDVVPWTVTIVPSVRPLPIGNCSPISIDLRDPATKAEPRNPKGGRVSLADFDINVTSAQNGAVVGRPDNVSAWSVCGCQAAAVGTVATITASYPARAIADAARVPGVAFQSSTTISLAAATGTGNPLGCGASQPKPALIAPASSAVLPPAPLVVTTPAAATAAAGAAASRGAEGVGTAPRAAGRPTASGAGVAGAVAGGAAATGGAATGRPPGVPIKTSLFEPGPVTVTLGLNAHGLWFEPSPVAMTLGLSAHGSWFEPAPVALTLGLNAHGSWFEPAPVTLTLELSATGRWIERTAPPTGARPQER